MNLHTGPGIMLLDACGDKGAMITHEITFNLHVLLISGLYYVSKYEGLQAVIGIKPRLCNCRMRAWLKISAGGVRSARRGLSAVALCFVFIPTG